MKAEIRARMKAARLSLSAGERAGLSAQIQENAWPLIANAERVLLYRAFAGEVETDSLARRLLDSGKALYYPRVTGKASMQAVRVRSLEGFVPSRMGVPEPRGAEAAEAIDCVVLPGLAFSPMGARLGFGAGYYDRFLEGKAGRRIGLAYSFQIVSGLAVEPHDIPVHAVVTEGGVLIPSCEEDFYQ